MTSSVAILSESAGATTVLQHTRQTLESFAVPLIERMVPDRAALREIVMELESAGVAVFIVANTSTDALSVAVSEITTKPLLAVPIDGPGFEPLDALRGSARGGAVVGTLAVGKAGAINAALLVVAILANADAELRSKLERFRQEQTAKVLAETPG